MKLFLTNHKYNKKVRPIVTLNKIILLRGNLNIYTEELERCHTARITERRNIKLF